MCDRVCCEARIPEHQDLPGNVKMLCCRDRFSCAETTMMMKKEVLLAISKLKELESIEKVMSELVFTSIDCGTRKATEEKLYSSLHQEVYTLCSGIPGIQSTVYKTRTEQILRNLDNFFFIPYIQCKTLLWGIRYRSFYIVFEPGL